MCCACTHPLPQLVLTVSKLGLFAQHFLEEINGAWIAGFAERTYRLLAYELIRMRPRDLDQDRHRFLGASFADRAHSLHLHFSIPIRALRGRTQKLEAAFTGALAE